MRPGHVILLVMLLVACDKSSAPVGGASPGKDPATPPSVSPAALSASKVAMPSVSASAVPSVAASVVGPEPRASADAARPKDGGGAALLKPATKHIPGSNFALDLASPGCNAATECVMTVTLAASGDYHVNKDYPYKFVATAAPGVAFLGKSGAETFSRAAGDFTTQSEKSGTMTVRFKPSSAGDVRIAGTYKFSVCSADQCQVEQEKIELTVPVM